MSTTLIAQAEDLRHVAQRLQRAGLVIDRSVLSPASRRAVFALQCREASVATQPERPRRVIGFAIPTSR